MKKEVLIWISLFLLTLTFALADGIAPQMVVLSPGSQSYTTTHVPLNVTTPDLVNEWNYSINGGENITFVPNITLILSSGEYNISIYATDADGDINTTAISFNITSLTEQNVSGLVNTTLLTWTVPMSALWNVSYVFNMYNQNTTPNNLSQHVYYNESVLFDQTCSNCTHLNYLDTLSNENLSQGQTLVFNYSWILPDVQGFDDWLRISHYNGNDSYSETNGWTYDGETGQIRTNVNSVGFIGVVSPENYSNYTFEVVFRSDNSDDDTISFILAFFENESGQYTLTANRAAGGVGAPTLWWVEYEIDSFHPEEADVIYNGTENISIAGGSWSNYVNGTKVRANRTGELITIITTELNNDTYKENTQYTINLSDDPRLTKFLGATPIGYGAVSQQGSYFTGVAVQDPMANVSFNLSFSCRDEGCVCDANSDCNSNNCRVELNGTNYYCAASSNVCSQAYNVSLSAFEFVNTNLCLENSTTAQCNQANVCSSFGGIVCAPNQTWQNATVSAVGCDDGDADGIYDYDDDLEGNASSIGGSGLGSVQINISGNVSAEDATGVQNVSIISNNVELVTFSHNFSQSQLSIPNITIVKSSEGLITRLGGQLQSGQTKTIRVLDNNFLTFCVKDAEVSSLSQISSSCNGVNETDFTSCLGNSTGATIGNLTCIDSGSILTVSNLTHSAARGTVEEEEETSSSSSSGSTTSSSRIYTLVDGFNRSVYSDSYLYFENTSQQVTVNSDSVNFRFSNGTVYRLSILESTELLGHKLFVESISGLKAMISFTAITLDEELEGEEEQNSTVEVNESELVTDVVDDESDSTDSVIETNEPVENTDFVMDDEPQYLTYLGVVLLLLLVICLFWFLIGAKKHHKKGKSSRKRAHKRQA